MIHDDIYWNCHGNRRLRPDSDRDCHDCVCAGFVDDGERIARQRSTGNGLYGHDAGQRRPVTVLLLDRADQRCAADNDLKFSRFVDC